MTTIETIAKESSEIVFLSSEINSLKWRRGELDGAKGFKARLELQIDSRRDSKTIWLEKEDIKPILDRMIKERKQELSKLEQSFKIKTDA